MKAKALSVYFGLGATAGFTSTLFLAEADPAFPSGLVSWASDSFFSNFCCIDATSELLVLTGLLPPLPCSTDVPGRAPAGADLLPNRLGAGLSVDLSAVLAPALTGAFSVTLLPDLSVAFGTGLASPLFPPGGVCLLPPDWGVALRLLSAIPLPPALLLLLDVVLRDGVRPREAAPALPGLGRGEVTLAGGEVPLPREVLEPVPLVGEVMIPLPPPASRCPLEAAFSVGVFLSFGWISETTLSGGNTILSGGKTGRPGQNAGAVLLQGTVCTFVGLAAVVVVREEGGEEEVVEVGLETLTGG